MPSKEILNSPELLEQILAQPVVKAAAPVQGYQKLMTKILAALGVGKTPSSRYVVGNGVKTMNPPSPSMPGLAEGGKTTFSPKSYIEFVREAERRRLGR